MGTTDNHQSKNSASVQDEAEECFIQYLEAVERYQMTMSQLSRNLKDGIFDLTRARHGQITTRTSIDSSAYPARIQPMTYVARVNGSDKSQPMQMRRVDFVNDFYDSPEHVGRASGGASKRGGSGTGESQSSEQAQHKKKGHNPDNPLFWFGALPSPHLRKAQTQFNSAVDVVLELANLQQKMLSLKDRYERLRTQVKAEPAVQKSLIDLEDEDEFGEFTSASMTAFVPMPVTSTPVSGGKPGSAVPEGNLIQF
eukprot:GFYU01008506.1.p1 GENE.GFYU01008506.1~~GFYU01008506.1.p1  ORF type:complete len:254 (-),score=40.71 GFYU01008506.1:43-804(-)